MSLLGFFSRGPDSASAPPPRAQRATPIAGHPDDTSTPVVDCIGAVLQCWALHPIVLPDEDRTTAVRTITEWQRHATLGTPIAGLHDAATMVGPVHARDWAALTVLTGERRRAEAANVGEHLGALQTAVWDTVSTLARLAGDDITTTAAVESQLARLRACSERGDAASVVRELPGALHAITDALAAHTTRAATERKAMAARVESLGRALSDAEDSARTDALTGAGNRLRFAEVTERALALMTLTGSASSLIAIDIDGLKVINDMHGHAAGDAAITAVAKACWTICTRPSDVLCRLGGDEFAVVMTNTDATSAATLADRLEQRLHGAPITLLDSFARVVTASIGVATAQPGESAEAWVARADKRLYDAKHSRKS